MKTEYKYIPITFERASDAVKACEEGLLFDAHRQEVKNVVSVVKHFNHGNTFFTRRKVAPPTPKEALGEFLVNARMVSEHTPFGWYIEASHTQGDLEYDEEFVEACRVVVNAADAHRAMESDE